MEENKKFALQMLQIALKQNLNDPYFGLSKEEYEDFDKECRKTFGVDFHTYLEEQKQANDNPKVRFKNELTNCVNLRNTLESSQKVLLRELFTTYTTTTEETRLTLPRALNCIYIDDNNVPSLVSIKELSWEMEEGKVMDVTVLCADNTSYSLVVLDVDWLELCRKIWEVMYESNS